MVVRWIDTEPVVAISWSMFIVYGTDTDTGIDDDRITTRLGESSVPIVLPVLSRTKVTWREFNLFLHTQSKFNECQENDDEGRR